MEYIDKDHMILILIDAGFKVKVTDQSIYQLGTRWQDNTDAEAHRCEKLGFETHRRPAALFLHIWAELWAHNSAELFPYLNIAAAIQLELLII